MRIILKIGDPCRLYLVELVQPASVVKVRELAGRGRYTQAMVTALSSHGSAEELTGPAAAGMRVDLVLTEQSAYWDASGQ